MHLYNSWLPPPIVQETIREKEAFSRVVLSLNNSYHPGDPDSVYATLKWISVIHLYVYNTITSFILWKPIRITFSIIL